MEIGFDQDDWRIRAQAQDGTRMDWHALRARLAASHAARMAFAQIDAENAASIDRTHDSVRSGCFDRVSARSVAAFGHALADVNPTALGNGNSETGKDASVAGASHTGGRG